MALEFISEHLKNLLYLKYCLQALPSEMDVLFNGGGVASPGKWEAASAMLPGFFDNTESF